MVPNQKTRSSSVDLIRSFDFFNHSHSLILDSPRFLDSLTHGGSVNLPSEAGYNVIADVYDTSPWAKFWDRNEQPLFEEILSQLGDLGSALDVGSGTGRYSKLLLRYATSVTGVDISEGMVRIAREKTARAEFFRNDIWSFLAKSQKYDVVTCARVLSHILDAEGLVRKIISEHLTEVGTIVISDLHPRHSYRTTSFEVGGFRINLDTFKHDIQKFQVMPEVVEWKLTEFSYDDLRWKPSPHRFSTILPESGLPIFYILTGRRRAA